MLQKNEVYATTHYFLDPTNRIKKDIATRQQRIIIAYEYV